MDPEYSKFIKMIGDYIQENKRKEVVSLYLNIFGFFSTCFMLNIFKNESKEAEKVVEMLIDMWRKTLEEKIGEELNTHDSFTSSSLGKMFAKGLPRTAEIHQEFDEALYRAEQIVRDVLQMEKTDENKENGV